MPEGGAPSGDSAAFLELVASDGENGGATGGGDVGLGVEFVGYVDLAVLELHEGDVEAGPDGVEFLALVGGRVKLEVGLTGDFGDAWLR